MKKKKATFSFKAVEKLHHPKPRVCQHLLAGTALSQSFPHLSLDALMRADSTAVIPPFGRSGQSSRKRLSRAMGVVTETSPVASVLPI